MGSIPGSGRFLGGEHGNPLQYSCLENSMNSRSWWVTVHRLTKCVSVCVCISSVAQSCPTLCNPMDCSMPGLPVYHQLLELTQTHVHRAGDAIQPSHPLSFPFLPPSIFPSIRVFSNESFPMSLCIRWPKYWSFS